MSPRSEAERGWALVASSTLRFSSRDLLFQYALRADWKSRLQRSGCTGLAGFTPPPDSGFLTEVPGTYPLLCDHWINPTPAKITTIAITICSVTGSASRIVPAITATIGFTYAYDDTFPALSLVCA